MTIERATRIINAEVMSPRRDGRTVQWAKRFRELGLIERRIRHDDWSGAHSLMMNSKLPYTWTGATFFFEDDSHAAFFDVYLA